MEEVAKDAPNGFRNLKCSPTSNDLRIVPFAGCEEARVYEDKGLRCAAENIKDPKALESRWSIALRKCANDFQELNPHTATSQYIGTLATVGLTCCPSGDVGLQEVDFGCDFWAKAK